MRSRTPAVVAALVAAAVALIVFLVVMSHTAPRRTGTNSSLVPTHAVIPAGRQLCDDNVDVPAGSDAAAPWAGGYAGATGPPVTVKLWSQAGTLVATGRSPATYPTGIVLFGLDRRVQHELTNARVCFRNRGHGLLNLYGDFSPHNRHVSAPAYADDVPVRIRLDWYRSKPRSWWDFSGTIADRFPLMKAGFLGPWAFWAALALLLAVSVAAVVRVVREAPR